MVWHKYLFTSFKPLFSYIVVILVDRWFNGSLFRQLFNLAEGGMSEASDTFKHLSAAFTVLRSLSSAQTATNKESSRIGHFIEVQVTDNVLNRTKIHCYFLDQVWKNITSLCIVLLKSKFPGFWSFTSFLTVGIRLWQL